MKTLSNKSAITPTILEVGKEIRLKKGDFLTQQFAKANDFYLLKSGSVRFSLAVDESVGEIHVGESSERYTPVGWSGFNAPGRYATTAKVSSSSASFIKWSHKDLQELMTTDPEAGTNFLREVCAQTRVLLVTAIKLLSSQAKEQDQIDPADPVYTTSPAPTDENLAAFLRKSSFFEVFDESPIEFLSQGIERRLYAPNATIFTQETEPDGIYILGSGKVRFSYQSDDNRSIGFRQITTPGFLIGWSAGTGQTNMVNAHAVQETLVYFIPRESLNRVLKLHPDFTPQFYRRLLWLISYRLQAIRARIIASGFKHELIAISNLIDQNSARLDLSSPLHKIPHLLDNKHTVDDALVTLENLRVQGTSLEKNIATTALDVLEETYAETNFYKGLVNVYKSVVQAPKDASVLDVRKICAQSYISVFDKQRYILQGTENLPKESGNIFIYNHLRNHPYNTLPNQFQITLDSHFISSMILMKNYDDPGLRIVRVGQSKEFAHQEYYQRLGHIDVYTDDSKSESKKIKKQVRQMFYNEAGAYVSGGGNLIISPEGSSYSTEESPGPFKPGAFNLALNMKKEPYIVPLVMANFDKRARNNRFVCLILPPFKVSDYIRDKEDKAQMHRFLVSYQETYRSYVQQAIALSQPSTDDNPAK